MCARHGLVALGARTAGHANLAGAHHQEFSTLELVSVVIQYPIELCDLDLQLSSGKPKEHHAGVDESLVEDQLGVPGASAGKCTVSAPA
jgi:hypothetical protein